MEREVLICSPAGRPESQCSCYACRVRRLVEQNEGLRTELDELRQAVADMRHAQREYFRTRSDAALRAAKRAEKRVDELLRRQAEPQLF